MKDKPKLNPRKKQKERALAKYLTRIVQDKPVDDHAKLDVCRAHIYGISRKKMYAIFWKGCSYCREEFINYTKLSLIFNRFGTPRAICKKCCDRKYGENMWAILVTNRIKKDL